MVIAPRPVKASKCWVAEDRVLCDVRKTSIPKGHHNKAKRDRTRSQRLNVHRLSLANFVVPSMPQGTTTALATKQKFQYQRHPPITQLRAELGLEGRSLNASLRRQDSATSTRPIQPVHLSGAIDQSNKRIRTLERTISKKLNNFTQLFKKCRLWQCTRHGRCRNSDTCFM